tara:strand:+ start:163 stop:372 length:210 start_codon:yes stop_codon:yes gene_type:complete
MQRFYLVCVLAGFALKAEMRAWLWLLSAFVISQFWVKFHQVFRRVGLHGKATANAPFLLRQALHKSNIT